MTEEKFKRLIKIVFAVLAVVFVIGAAVIIVSGLHEEREESAAVESIEQEMGNGSFFGSDDHGAPGAPGLAVEDPYSETGEPGDDGEKEHPRKYVFTPVVPATRKRLIDLALEYDGFIPYATGGRYYYDGFPKYPGGIDNRGAAPEQQTGMDSYGYVYWLYKNVFGSLGEEWFDISTLYETAMSVSVSDIQVGDIGMMQPADSKRNHFGVCVGFINGHPVFTHCLNSPVEKYPLGNNRLSFVKSDFNSYIRGSAPVEFKEFIRPAVNWEGEE